MMRWLRKSVPAGLMAFYHRTLAVLADFYYGRPSKKMIIIGVTGTNGKTTVVSLIVKILETAGYKVGAASTAIFKIDQAERLNDRKMTMLGRFALQKLLAEMAAAGCQYAIIETSSQGIEQFRHAGIRYDVAVFTNLTPEHIEAHGGFGNYKAAKLKLFKHLEKSPVKIIGGKKIAKAIVVNGDDKYAGEFLNFRVDEKYVFGLNHKLEVLPMAVTEIIFANNLEYSPAGVGFKVDYHDFNLKLLGRFNVYNSLAAIAVAQSQGIGLLAAKKSLEQIAGVPGRLEFIEAGQPFKVLIDYAPEPESLRQLFETIKLHQLAPAGQKIIHVFGSCGGGRDTARRPVLGRLSAEQADIQIVTNEDPYDDDPNTIIDQVAEGAISRGKILGDNLFKFADRREAIKFALSLAQAGDLVLLTGKGSEQAICAANGRKIPWDERQVVRELLA